MRIDKPESEWYSAHAAVLVEGLSDGPNYVKLAERTVKGPDGIDYPTVLAIRPQLFISPGPDPQTTTVALFGKLSILPAAELYGYTAQLLHEAFPKLIPHPEFVSERRVGARWSAEFVVGNSDVDTIGFYHVIKASLIPSFVAAVAKALEITIDGKASDALVDAYQSEYRIAYPDLVSKLALN